LIAAQCEPEKLALIGNQTGATQMTAFSISDFRKAMREGPYAWPGGYPLYFVTSDSEPLSFKAAAANRRNILDAIHNRDGSGWRIVAVDINWEDASLYCSHTNERIESAYAEDEAVAS
jgi:hypothetical protein